MYFEVEAPLAMAVRKKEERIEREMSRRRKKNWKRENKNHTL